MKLKKAQKVFKKLQADLKKGKISDTDFQSKVNAINAESPDGAQWKVGH